MPLLVPVEFLPANRTAWVRPGVTLLDAARQVGVSVSATCAGRGTCGGCVVRLISGSLVPPDEREAVMLRHAAAPVRLACRARVDGPVTVRVPMFGRTQRTVSAMSEGPLLVAVDLGTTGVAALAVDAAAHGEIGRAVVPNAQSTWGADVVSRMAAAMSGDRAALHRAAVASVLDAISAVTANTSDIVRCVIAGNPVMSALLVDVDVSGMAAYPLETPTIPVRLDSGHPLSIALPSSEILLVPMIAGLVGGDVAAGVVGTQVGHLDGVRLLVDIGTNAEIVLLGHGEPIVTSAAAGPAFDGVGISCGGPAVEGAVVSVRAADDLLRPEVLGAAPPRWLSGSGAISLVAALMAAGHITPDGAMTAEGPYSDAFSADGDGVLGIAPFVGMSELRFTQLDVRAIQLAKAAVRVGIDAVLREAGISASEVTRAYISGAFGTALAPEDLVAIGMLPASFSERTESLGNSSLQGALSIAADPDLLERAQTLSRDARNVTLAADPGFNEALIDALALRSDD